MHRSGRRGGIVVVPMFLRWLEDRPNRVPFFPEESSGSSGIGDHHPLGHAKASWVDRSLAAGDVDGAVVRTLFLKIWPGVALTKDTSDSLRGKRAAPDLRLPLVCYAGITLFRFDGVEVDPATYTRDDLLRDVRVLPALEPLVAAVERLPLDKAREELGAIFTARSGGSRLKDRGSET